MGPEPFRILRTLYFGENAEKRKDELLRAVSGRKPVPGLYLITFASNGIDQLDILPFYAALQKHVTEKKPVLAGICLGREEAFQTVERMASDAYRETGACHLQEYLSGLEMKRR